MGKKQHSATDKQAESREKTGDQTKARTDQKNFKYCCVGYLKQLPKQLKDEIRKIKEKLTRIQKPAKNDIKQHTETDQDSLRKKLKRKKQQLVFAKKIRKQIKTKFKYSTIEGINRLLSSKKQLEALNQVVSLQSFRKYMIKKKFAKIKKQQYEVYFKISSGFFNLLGIFLGSTQIHVVQNLDRVLKIIHQLYQQLKTFFENQPHRIDRCIDLRELQELQSNLKDSIKQMLQKWIKNQKPKDEKSISLQKEQGQLLRQTEHSLHLIVQSFRLNQFRGQQQIFIEQSPKVFASLLKSQLQKPIKDVCQKLKELDQIINFLKEQQQVITSWKKIHQTKDYHFFYEKLQKEQRDRISMFRVEMNLCAKIFYRWIYKNRSGKTSNRNISDEKQEKVTNQCTQQTLMNMQQVEHEPKIHHLDEQLEFELVNWKQHLQRLGIKSQQSDQSIQNSSNNTNGDHLTQ